MKLASRVEKLPPYLFVEISRKIAAKKQAGADVISFGIGDPDIPTPKHILEEISNTTNDPKNHRYPDTEGLPELRQAIAKWYKNRFDVTLNYENEILPLIGAKEGIGHFPLCYVDPGDIALIPDPAYPVYAIGTLFAGGTSHLMPLTEDNDWLPDLGQIPNEIAKKATMLWINYPNNPTGALGNIDFFKEAISFAKKNDVIVCHDAAYSEVTFDNYVAPSILEQPDALDHCVEFHSLSKTYNMTGWRIGMAVGNSDAVDALMRVKSNLDSGIPQAIQYAAIEALGSPPSVVEDNNKIYLNRRDKMLHTLRKIGLEVVTPKAGLYVWAKLPNGWTSAAFTAVLLDELDIVVTPGTGYGKSGEGFIRLSLTTPDDRIDQGLKRLSEWQIPNPVNS